MLYLTKVEDARAYGCVELLPDNQVKSFLEKMENPVSNMINAGCYIFNRKVIDQIPTNQVVSVERDTFPSFLNSGVKVYGYLDNSYWLDIGNPQALVKASADLITGVITSVATPKHNGDHLIAANAQVSPSAIINLGTVIEPEVVVEGNCQISGSIISNGAKIGANCKIINSIIAPDTHIEAGMIVISNYLGF
jgi:mannose-1-phosphate guanylyltransferase